MLSAASSALPWRIFHLVYLDLSYNSETGAHQVYDSLSPSHAEREPGTGFAPEVWASVSRTYKKIMIASSLSMFLTHSERSALGPGKDLNEIPDCDYMESLCQSSGLASLSPEERACFPWKACSAPCFKDGKT